MWSWASILPSSPTPKTDTSNDLANPLYQVQTWNYKPEIQIYQKYMYSIPAMLKESVVTTLRFSEERMYDYIEKYFLDNY